MYKLSDFQGPLLTINSDGIIDHFNRYGQLSWEQIKFVGCKETWGRETYKYFVVIPAKRTLSYHIRRPFSRPMRYKLERLAIPESDIPEIYDVTKDDSLEYVYEADITEALKKVAPKHIL